MTLPIANVQGPAAGQIKQLHPRAQGPSGPAFAASLANDADAQPADLTPETENSAKRSNEDEQRASADGNADPKSPAGTLMQPIPSPSNSIMMTDGPTRDGSLKDARRRATPIAATTDGKSGHGRAAEGRFPRSMKTTPTSWTGVAVEVAREETHFAPVRSDGLGDRASEIMKARSTAPERQAPALTDQAREGSLIDRIAHMPSAGGGTGVLSAASGGPPEQPSWPSPSGGGRTSLAQPATAAAGPLRRLELRLSPHDLGAISISMTADDMLLRIEMKAEKDDAVDRLESVRPELEHHLLGSGHLIEEIVVAKSPGSAAPDDQGRSGGGGSTSSGEDSKHGGRSPPRQPDARHGRGEAEDHDPGLARPSEPRSAADQLADRRILRSL